MESISGGKRPKLVTISLLNFFSFLDINLLIPVLALYASILGAGPGVIGLLIGLYSVTNTPMNVIAGRWVDRTGYKLPLVIGLIGGAASMFGYSLTRLPVHLAVVRAVHGVCGGLKSPAVMAAFTESAGETGRGRVMGFYGMSLATANLVGFGLSGVIVSRLGYSPLFFFGAAVLAVGAVIGLSLPGGKPKREIPARPSLRQDYREVKGLLGRKRLLVSYLAIFGQYFAFGGIVTLLPLYVRDLGMDAFHVGMLLTVFTVVFIALQFPSGILSDRLGRLKLIYLGLSAGVIALVLLPLLTAFFALALAMALYGAAFGFLFPSVSAQIADRTSPAERGTASGIFHALLTAGVASGAPVIGGLGSVLGVETGLALSPVVLVLVLGASWLLTRNHSAAEGAYQD